MEGKNRQEGKEGESEQEGRRRCNRELFKQINQYQRERKFTAGKNSAGEHSGGPR